ncbi:MAG: hypothetical protein M5T61_01750 [Acidimicrobiia bacterium]|nr:hypothetical protein [Acidimicrobiia bacterium]
MTEISESPERVRFRVDRVGVPVVVKVSYFPNWEVSGAEGPWRLSPNLMVVVPTDEEVTLTYGLTKADWAGRVGTVLGIAGLVLLFRWGPRRRNGATPGAPDVPAPVESGGPALP